MAIQTYGTQKRANPRLAVLRGWDINNPTNIAPRAESSANQGSILSGELISKDTATGKWVVGCASVASAPTIAFAVQDDVDFDVIGSGVLTGISVLGKYELQTPFFKSADTYTEGAPLTYDGTTGSIKVTTLESGEPIIGFVTGGKINVASTNSNVELTSGNSFVVQFVTNYLSNTADAT